MTEYSLFAINKQGGSKKEVRAMVKPKFNIRIKPKTIGDLLILAAIIGIVACVALLSRGTR